MAEFNNNYATQCAVDAFSAFEYDYQNIPGKEYIESLNIVTTFYDYTHDYAKSSGYTGAKSDPDVLAKYIYDSSVEKQAPLSSLNTVKNWLKKAPPTGTQTGRENVYRLCFTLGLNAIQTKEFFLKAYLERPFNYKNIRESVYFFCMNNGLGYTDAERIIQRIPELPLKAQDDAEIITERIGYELSLLKNEDDIVKYLIENLSVFSVQNTTATKKIQELIEQCKVLAERELFIPDEDKALSVTTIDELLGVIYGYSARATKNKQCTHKITISKSNFPKLIRENFPQRQQIENILVGKASFDVIRKALIMLNFYYFFADACVNKENDYSHYWFDEFVNETNTMLAECGYVQLYWRNPYDWMFGYCASALDVGVDPLEQFRMLIEEFYLKPNNPDGVYYDETHFTIPNS